MIEVRRGCIPISECDALGHLHSARYAEHAELGVDSVAAIGGRSLSAWRIRDLHIRFFHELVATTPTSMNAGVIEHSATAGTFRLEYRRTLENDVAASLLARVSVVEGDARPWPRIEGLEADLPGELQPRGIPFEPFDKGEPEPGFDEIGRMRMFCTLRRHVVSTDFEAAHPGQVSLSTYLGWLSNPMPSPFVHCAQFEPGFEHTSVAQLESRIVHRSDPALGAPIEVWCGLRAVARRTFDFVHWIFDRSTAKCLASARVIAIPFDLEARMALPIDEKVRAIASELAVPELGP